LQPAETFFLLMRPANPFFVKMWPAYETEFETPGLEKLFHKIEFKKIQNSEKTIANRMWQHGLSIH